MSRLTKYKESLNRFIKDKSCMSDKECIPNADITTIAYNRIKKSNLLLPILCLTVMNNQNKKKKVMLQGYYAAASIEFLSTLINITDSKKKFITDFGTDHYAKIVNYLTICSIQSLHQNLESTHSHVTESEMVSIFFKSTNVYNDTVTYKGILKEHVFEVTNNKPHQDLIKGCLKEDIELINKFKNIKQIKRDDYNSYIESKVGNLCQLTLCIGWLIGCGSIDSLPKIKKVSIYFAYLYKLAEDFENIKENVDGYDTVTGICNNFVVNYGLQEGYEVFMHNKQKFIEEAMTLDIFTSTVKEIMNEIEQKVENVIDDTSPDIKSSCSNIYTVSFV